MCAQRKEHVMNTTRTLAEVQLPAAGLWQIDPGHAEVAFVGRHFGLTKVRGRFPGVTGAVVIGDDISVATVDVAIEMASVSSGDQSRDDHLRSADFFDVDHYPMASFRSVSTTVGAQGRTGSLMGELTIKNVTRSVALDVEYLGRVT